MISFPRKVLRLLLGLLILLSLAGYREAQAQTASRASLTAPDTSSFPTITTYLDIRDAQGNFIKDLQSSQVTILEDKTRLPVNSIEETHSGVQFVIALNPGPSFAIRGGEGRSRYERLTQSFRDWADANQGTSSDDYSLLTTDGTEATHLSSPAAWLSALEAYQGDLRNSNPTLNTLVQAMETAADPSQRPGMGRAVLYITSPLQGNLAAGLKSLAERANQQGIRIFVWLVSTPDVFTTDGAVLLQNLAVQTHGQFFGFSGIEPIPDLEAYLKPLRDTYKLVYTSQAAKTGPHMVSVDVQLSEEKISTPLQTFTIEIEPPSPMFVSPPQEIVREDSPQTKGGQDLLSPTEESLELLIEFPDGFSRQILTTTLFVDGAVAFQRSSAPFDQLQWNLKNYQDSGDHQIRVEVIDSLGLKGSSSEVPVHITVKRTPRTVVNSLSRRIPLLAGVVVLFSGTIFLMVMILGGRIRPQLKRQGSTRELQVRPMKSKEASRRDPVTQPVKAREESTRRLPGWMNRIHWPQRKVTANSIAFLTRLSTSEDEKFFAPIPVATEIITLGSNPLQSSLVVDDASVEPFHAWMKKEGKSYRLADEGTIAGTWVNYTPISKEGVILEHGDLVHIGRVSFRFTLREPERVRKPVILREDHLF